MATLMDNYMDAFGVASSSAAAKQRRERAIETAAAQARRASERKSRRARIRAYRQKYGSSAERIHAGYTASELQYFKSKGRRKLEKAEQKQEAATNTRLQRMHQLAGMAGGRGRPELKRLLEGGNLKETAAEKRQRQRRTQLEGMPEGRGKKLSQEMNKIAKGFGATPKPTASPAPPPATAKPAEPKKALIMNPYTTEQAKKAADEARKKREALLKKQQKQS